MKMKTQAKQQLKNSIEGISALKIVPTKDPTKIKIIKKKKVIFPL